MSFTKHLFISYAHIDNQPLTPEQQGWITRFHATLEALLSMRLGSKAEIWRDEKLQGNDIFADEITAQFPHTALLVSVLTPRYLNSEWCTREVHEFCQSAEQNGGVVVENKARVFKVIKTPVDTEASLHPVMQESLGYEFFTFEDDTPLELDPAYGEKFAQDYNRKVGKLAWDVAQLLKRLETYAPESRDTDGGEQTATKSTVYLAECSYDQREAREILQANLERHGYTVLPDQPLPRDEAEYVAAVARILERCALAIHLVGEGYGAVPDGPSHKSVTVLQNELAIQQSKNRALTRVIWLREGMRSENSQQQAFIEALNRDAETQFGADLITGDLEALKASIHAMLKQLEQPEPESPKAPGEVEDSAKLVYLICDEKDRKATVPIRRFCRAEGFEVILPAFEGDATAVREANRKLLTNCDAVILFYGTGDEAWKRTVDNDLKKMKSYRSGKPPAVTYTYLAEPATSDKEDLIDMEEPNLINGLADFPEAEMKAFTQAVNPSGATA
ncbi:toll/interleukin-1 receptor domain-containing protein [Candidatus Entotheonella palauensis]|uniref:toll/interleukin-1 receptor domain-containing protein n=1 Tax=Candidatus Entotheonella palauensis TaxID=93172 RepID=UPI000B7F22EF|nr:toll/interleukin-1 receptor domain-containing protein [Candidatus Entotheonella palauensis]